MSKIMELNTNRNKMQISCCMCSSGCKWIIVENVKIFKVIVPWLKRFRQ